MAYADYAAKAEASPHVRLISALGRLRQNCKPLCYGEYKELLLTNRQYAFARDYRGERVLVTVNNDDGDAVLTLPAGGCARYVGALSGQQIAANGDAITLTLKANSGEIWLPCDGEAQPASIPEQQPEAIVFEPEPIPEPAPTPESEPTPEPAPTPEPEPTPAKSFEEMSVEELQQAILERMRRNGPVTDYMRGTVAENTHHGSLVTWVKSFVRE